VLVKEGFGIMIPVVLIVISVVGEMFEGPFQLL